MFWENVFVDLKNCIKKSAMEKEKNGMWKIIQGEADPRLEMGQNTKTLTWTKASAKADILYVA